MNTFTFTDEEALLIEASIIHRQGAIFLEMSGGKLALNADILMSEYRVLSLCLFKFARSKEK